MRLGALAGGVDGRVLEKERGVADAVIGALGEQPALELPRLLVRQRALAIPVVEDPHAIQCTAAVDDDPCGRLGPETLAA